MHDKAIEYNAKLGKVQNTLERMQKIGLNITTYNELLDQIDNELKESVENNNQNLFNSMKTDILNMAYSKALNKLNIMYTELKKYDVYLKTAGFCSSLKVFLTKEDHNPQELVKYSTKILELLQEIKKSDTLDYQVEGSLVEDIYHLAYEFIKIEIILTKNSIVLNEIKNNEVDISYIEKEIIRELESMDLKQSRYTALVNKKYEIESEGLETTYVNLDFIALIANNTIGYKEQQKLLKRLTNDFECYYHKITTIDEEIKRQITMVDQKGQDIKKRQEQEYREIGRQALRVVVSLGTLVSLAVGSYLLSREISKQTKVKSTTTTYSTIAEPVIEEEYIPIENAINSKFLYKYSPYEGPNFLNGFIYTRKITEYDLTGTDDMDLEEILDLNFASLGFVGKTTYEKKQEITLSDLYKESYYLLKETNVDELDIIEERDLGTFWSCLITLLVIITVMDHFIIEDKWEDLFNEKTEYWGFIDGIQNIINSYRTIMTDNKELTLKKKELKEFLEA